MPRATTPGSAAARPAPLSAPLSPAAALLLLVALVAPLLGAQLVLGARADAAAPATSTAPATRVAGAVDESRVLVLGDSLTWRGRSELAAAHPSWTIDGVRGRSVLELPWLLRAHLRSSTPDAVVVALGTNTARRWTKDSYRRAAALVPRGVPLVFVTPYRDPRADTTRNARVKAERATRYATWMRELAREGGRRCVADWRALAAQHRWLLIDGVHQTPPAEQTWARVVGDAVARCS
ncbi:SGNH/GDSL hydrolase family protein [Nocardioides perillae]|uniref:Lysophospholipase L1-like esterase n=1 Tax=Nocardioides perillae TaxID=1119534 RepID=A0A7Y9RZE4_9ACTN|nr:GDSL-type esterase/lipase family protein [Nocardioides perillae]NYG56765.1 lysophospholipase L1-like esterase [Nocardioides perillae]